MYRYLGSLDMQTPVQIHLVVSQYDAGMRAVDSDINDSTSAFLKPVQDLRSLIHTNLSYACSNPYDSVE
jgi:hypothetical protein